jgi:4-amino-4-deoxy-L-arabinose transferase-like glycosyltransferase
MTAPQQTQAAPPATGSHALAPGAGEAPRGRGLRRMLAWPAARHLALAPVLALSAVLNVNHLAQNGYANIFYSAGVKSMLRSLHNFAYVSFDPGGLIMVDKPPLGLWLQAASASVFGFRPLSLLLPEALIGVLTVALIYRILAPRFGWLAAIAGAAALAVFPSFVAVSRDNGVDPLLILLMLLACWAGLRAAERGGWWALLASAVLAGLAFNTKTLAACLVLPGIAAGYAVCAPHPLLTRLVRLAVTALLAGAVSFSWIAFVELTPASSRPFVGGSKDNTELGLTFEYNGLGRVGGQEGGPGKIPVRPGAAVRVRYPPKRPGRPARAPAPKAKVIPFGGPPGPLRLFGKGLGDQGGWILPFALLGTLALLLSLAPARRPPEGAAGAERAASVAERRRDPRLAALLVLGGWFLAEAALLSFSKGIVHPYYVSALAPGAAAMTGAGLYAFTRLAARARWRWPMTLAPAAIGLTVAAQIVLLERAHYLHWFIIALLVGAGLAVLLLSWPPLARAALAPLLALLLLAPLAYSTTTWRAPVEGTFPAAGPRQATGAGGVGLSAKDVYRDRLLINYVRTHTTGSRWELFTDSSPTAAPFILLGLHAAALAGYSGTDPALDGRGLARMVARREARYVLLGGEFSTRGGNRATAAVLRACRELPLTAWLGPEVYFRTLVLFDCAGRERGLRAE